VPDPAATEPPPPPVAAALVDLPADVWAALLPTVRAALHDVDEAAVTPVVRRMRAAPAGRLAGGRVRRELCGLLAEGGPAWAALHARLVDEDLVETWSAALAAPAPPPAPVAPVPPAAPDPRELDRFRDRLRETREERDALRRRLVAAEERARQAEESAAAAGAALDELRAELAVVREELAAAAAARESAVGRERRRGEVAQARLREELAGHRRADEERRAERRRADERRRAQAAEERERAQRRREAQDRGRRPRVTPGRPSVLPEGIVPGSAEAVALLLHPGRLVLVDGYNLTRQHRDHLDLETQRAWLVRLLANAALQRRVRPVAVFDGERASRGRPTAASREVEVRFTHEGVTADDEVVLAVEGTDEPVLVVTDDRELQARVRVSGADVSGTREFLWALG